MKIGFLSHAGSSIYHFRMPIIKALKARGDEVFIIVPQDQYTQKLQELDCNLIVYELHRSSLNPFVIFKNFFHLAKILKKLNLDLIQSAAHKSNTFGIFAATWAKIPYRFALIEGLGSFYIEQGLKANLVRFMINTLYKISFKLVYKFIFVNESNAQFMRNLGLKEDKICIIKSVGVNLTKFFPIHMDLEKKELFWKRFNIDKKPIVLMIARALWHKGVKEFYESAKILQAKANFVLIGGRDENLSCASLEFLTSSNVYYLGAKENIVEFLQNSDIFVLPSYKEGFPVSVLEAKACAKAIIVSDCEGCVEAISHAYDGLWAKTKDTQDLTDKILFLLEDERLRLNLGQNAAKDALKYDENLIAQRYLKLYDERVKNV
ncbi:glycosyltransferase family 4 protein [Campylobacter sp. VicNov18]|uniref:glycosyltransferase family 4 protein n=1 Tax=Campylobacter bilis TaxID=2691918 RepID=UPI00130E4DB0|nr:glycosyltransferase family 4 protein [Campylobacter bilis]MPV63634.1 glycosyltransferase [Campylobacter hepaticus]MBM0637135.1 glycosyltransferase [Campylobacter bilis]MCC8277851.1 glycosyltransferase family 4 protein [Campylobacter bilis]MCC8298782.1 glycosyltransferase family 4 protein [Campylobacter bilis]MCC8300761.1 glycosyltransferase family 4 protein [Campylobacter bilis]